MTTLAKWDPLRELEDFSSRLSSFFGKAPIQKRDDAWFTSAEWAPIVDICEDDREYLIKAELPGIEKDQVRVTVENGVSCVPLACRRMQMAPKSRRSSRTACLRFTCRRARTPNPRALKSR
jgi:HSP20 family protein